MSKAILLPEFDSLVLSNTEATRKCLSVFLFVNVKFFSYICRMNDGLNLFGKVVSGKLEITNREVLTHWLSTREEGADIVIKLRDQKDYQSNRQLRLLYAEFREISLHTGHSVEEVKSMMKMYHGYFYSHQIDGKEITILKSVSDFSKSELSTFIEQVSIWAAQQLNMKLLKNEDLKFLNECKI